MASRVQKVDSTVDMGTGEVLVHCAYDKLIPVERLIPNPRNPNRHPERQIDVLAKMIVAQGWRCPITVSNQSGFIVRGHGRLQAALRAGLSVAPVDYQDYENEAAEWADLIADNRIAELAETDFTALADLLTELDTGAFDLDLTGFSEGELKNIMGWTPEVVDVSAQDDDRGSRLQPGKGQMVVSIGTLSALVEYELVQALMEQIQARWGTDAIVQFVEWAHEGLS